MSEEMRELELAVELLMFWRIASSDNYMLWMKARLAHFNSYINQEADRTGKFPTGHMKDFLSLLKEQGNVGLANDVEAAIKRYS